MNRRSLLFATLAPTVGLGLLLFARREQIAPLISETMEAAPKVWREKMEAAPKAWRETMETAPGVWRETMDRRLAETSRMIEETREAIEDATRQARITARGAFDSALDATNKAVVGAIVTSLSLGLLTGLVVYIYAPERQQQEKLWQTAKPVLDSARETLARLWQTGMERREPRAQR